MFTFTKISDLTGATNTRSIEDVTREQVEAYYATTRNRFKAPILIQDAFPNLSDDDREFIKTGITPEEWDNAFDERSA